MDPSQSRDRGDDASLSASKMDPRAETAEDAGTRGNKPLAVAVTINRPREELFSFWRDFSNLPRFMDNLEQVDVIDPNHSHWVVKAPAGNIVEWDSRIIEESHGHLIAWESLEGADVPNSGRIDFRDAQGGRGTIVIATITYDPPAGMIGKAIAKLLQREPPFRPGVTCAASSS